MGLASVLAPWRCRGRRAGCEGDGYERERSTSVHWNGWSVCFLGSFALGKTSMTSPWTSDERGESFTVSNEA